MAASSVVRLEPGRKGGGSVGVAEEDLAVGPLDLQGAVEPFDLAVGLGPVWAGACVGDAGCGECVVPEVGLVARAVVGEYPLNRDAVGSEEELARCQNATAVAFFSSGRISL